MLAPKLFGALALAAAAVCLWLGEVSGRGSAIVLGIVGLSWLLGPMVNEGDE